jgi:TPR repeat protein
MRRMCTALLLLATAGCIGSMGGMASRPDFVSYDTTVREVVRRAADTGDAGGQAAAGYFFEHGENGFPQRDDEALRLYRLAAAQGNPAGLTNLAVFVATGRGVPRDDAEAVRLLSLAAPQGFEPAQLYLTAFYLAHRGNIADGDPAALAAVKAVVDRLMASRLCPSDYHFVLAIARLYEDGTSGLPRDLKEARRLYERMAASFPAGCQRPEAKERLAEMSANSTLNRQ